MKKIIFDILKKKQLLVLLLVLYFGMVSYVAYAEYDFNNNYMKRVVVSDSNQGMMFSSNYLTEGGNNVYQAKYVPKPEGTPDPSYTAYVYIWNFSTKNSAQTYPDDIDYTITYQVTDPSGTAVSDIGSRTITLTKPDNSTITIDNSNLSGFFTYTYNKTDSDNMYTISYNGWNPDTDSNLCLQLVAKPDKSTGKYKDLRDIGGIIGLKTETGSTGGGWEAYVSEINANKNKNEVDGYNLVITGSGKATVKIRWKPDMIDLNKYFKQAPIVNYPEVGTIQDELGENDQPTGWKYFSITADAGVRNRYNIQLYLLQGRPGSYDFFSDKESAGADTWVTYEITNITN